MFFQENLLHQQHQSPTASPTSKKSATLEPVYANVPHGAGNHPDSDTISEVDSKEKKGGKLSKFLSSRKHKVAN